MNIVFAEPIGLTPDDIQNFKVEMEKLGHSVTFFDNAPSGQNELLQRVVKAHIIVVSNYAVSASVIENAPNLKYIDVAFTGVDHIATNVCKKRSIQVSNAAGYSNQAVAELTMAMAIDLLRKITPADAVTRSLGGRAGFLGQELMGKTFGIMGLGQIGKRVAQLASAFGCRVIAWTRTPSKGDNVEHVEFEQLFKQSDILSIHLPLTPQTQNLIGIKELELMKPTAYLINTARAKIINTNVLADALKKPLIAGAAVDIYDKEPPIDADHPLLWTPNTLLLPHIGFATHEAIALRADIVLNNIRYWLNGNPQNLVG
ncbi:MAG: NAD(P)-dependent oxidoreductase [Tenuifilaceae bacterium]|nr:NAD(P)-dependent oxidoreductase [Tenuifilaceae bacterium]